MTSLTLAAYWHRLRYHDWRYEYSDDHSVWEKGRREHVALSDMRSLSSEHRALFNDFETWAWIDGAHMPARPTMEDV